LEDLLLDIVSAWDQCPTLRLDLPPFTLVGATTRPGLLTAPLRDRLGIALPVGFLFNEVTGEILLRAARILNITVMNPEPAKLLVGREGLPRIANRLAKGA
jgi:Holliday junction DNA helicase RuvB